MQRRLNKMIIRVITIINKNKKKTVRRAADAITMIRLLTKSLSVTYN